MLAEASLTNAAQLKCPRDNLVCLQRPILIVAIAATLAACSGQGQQEKASTNSVNAESRPTRQHGSWNMLNYTIAFNATGVEGGMADLVKAGKSSIGKKQFGGPLCLTADLASKDTLAARLQEAIRFGSEWKVIRSTLKNGSVDFEATMNDSQQGRGKMTITGQMTPTTTDLLVTTDSWQPAPGKGHIHTMMKTENTRMGECTPGQDVWQ